MPLLAILRIEGDPAPALQKIAALAKCTAYDARMRIAGGFPAIVARLDAVAAGAAVDELVAMKVGTVSVDEPLPTRADRLCAQQIGLGPGVIQFSSRIGATRIVKDDEIFLVLRGVRSTSATTRTTETIARTPTKGGVRTERVTKSTTKEALENLVLLYLAGGACIEIAEEEMQWTSLGDKRQLSGPANVQWMAAELKRRAPKARYDDSLVTIGKRTLPFVGASESASKVDRSETVDVIAAVLHRACVLGVL